MTCELCGKYEAEVCEHCHSELAQQVYDLEAKYKRCVKALEDVQKLKGTDFDENIIEDIWVIVDRALSMQGVRK